jgi:hypothetical protein
LARFVVFALLIAGVFASPRAFAQDRRSAGRVQVILSNLPPNRSAAHQHMLGLAGKGAKVQVLGYSNAEMWSIPRSRLDDVLRQGEALGVKASKLGTDWNHVLKPPSGPMSVSPAQGSMLKAVEGLKETMAVATMATPNAAVIEYALMKDAEANAASAGRLGTLPSKIVIPLVGDESVTARRTSVAMTTHGCTWRGEIEGTGEPVMLMWWKGGRMSGMFTHRGHIYTLKNIGGEMHAVVETDPLKMPPDHGAMRSQGSDRPQGNDLRDDPLVARGEGAPARDRSNPEGQKDAIGGLASPRETTRAGDIAQQKIMPLPAAKRRALAAKKIFIDVMFLYTRKVASSYIDVHADLIELSIEQANLSLDNSGLANIRLRRVHDQPIDYDEAGGEHFDHLYRMVDGIGAFAGVRALRDAMRADVVVLLVDDPSGCGLSTRVAADADEAFVVVHHSCAALTYSVAHEIGHIIGARHDLSLDHNMSPFPYGHGYVNGTKWRDVMSYKDSCSGCPRLPFWSSPNIIIRGEPGGTVDADNARVILEQAERVAKFR